MIVLPCTKDASDLPRRRGKASLWSGERKLTLVDDVMACSEGESVKSGTIVLLKVAHTMPRGQECEFWHLGMEETDSHVLCSWHWKAGTVTTGAHGW